MCDERKIVQPFRLTTEAVTQRCSVKKVFLKTSQNSQENTYARASFLKLQACNFIKKTMVQMFSCEFCKKNFKNNFFNRIP